MTTMEMELLEKIGDALSEPLVKKVVAKSQRSKTTYHDVIKGEHRSKPVIKAMISVMKEKKREFEILIELAESQLLHEAA